MYIYIYNNNDTNNNTNDDDDNNNNKLTFFYVVNNKCYCMVSNGKTQPYTLIRYVVFLNKFYFNMIM